MRHPVLVVKQSNRSLTLGLVFHKRPLVVKLYTDVPKVLGCIGPSAHPIPLTKNVSPSEKKMKFFMFYSPICSKRSSISSSIGRWGSSPPFKALLGGLSPFSVTDKLLEFIYKNQYLNFTIGGVCSFYREALVQFTLHTR